MIRPTALLKRSLIFVHRWLGVALAVLFMMWFVSGIVMMYWGFPGITAKDRLARALTLTPGQVTLTPEEAYAALGRDQPVASARLTSFDGRPVYQFGGGGGRGGGGGGGRGGGASMVFADDGSVRGAADGALVDRAAAAWAGRPLDDAKKESVEQVDQWTIAGQLRSLRPMFKYTFSDGQQVYVNGSTADVVQYTTTASRFWAYLGAIPHWVYFTPLRKHQQEWFSFVVYSSLIGTIAALMGVVIAIWMYSPRQRYRYAGAPTSIPYRSWKRWHTILGLFFGVLVTTWTFSGLLSMGPFPIVDKITALTVPSDPPPQNGATQGGGGNAGGGAGRGRGGGRGGPNIAGALRGGGRFELASYAARTPSQALALVPQFEVKELEYTSFAGEPVYMVTNADGDTRIVPVDGQPKESFDTQRVLEIVRAAAGGSLAEIKVIDQYDAYYLDRQREAPLPVVYARLSDAASTRYYVDPKTGRVVGNYSSRGWINRWLYHGLHSLDFPWLYNYRPLWDIVVITLMLGGTAVCVTSLVLAWQVLVRKVMRLVKPLAPRPTDDLAVES